MTHTAKINLAIKAIRSYAQEHYGWDAKFHPEQLDKYNALMDVIKELEEMKKNKQE